MPLVLKLANPSKLQHLEILISENEYWHFHLDDLAANVDFEADILDLHENGSLRRVTFTLKMKDRNAWEEEQVEYTIGEKFRKLRLLGILAVRLNQPSAIYPRTHI